MLENIPFKVPGVWGNTTKVVFKSTETAVLERGLSSECAETFYVGLIRM